MLDRLDLWSGETDTRSLIERSAQIPGLTSVKSLTEQQYSQAVRIYLSPNNNQVDFNYPQHITGSVEEEPQQLSQLKSTLEKTGLACSAVCLRFPKAFRLVRKRPPPHVFTVQSLS
jgi:hypothetical protein